MSMWYVGGTEVPEVRAEGRHKSTEVRVLYSGLRQVIEYRYDTLKDQITEPTGVSCKADLYSSTSVRDQI